MRVNSGIQIVPGRPGELLKAMRDVSPDDLGQLDPALLAWARRPLGREALSTLILQVAGSAWVCLLNLEAAGFIAIERRATSARIRALAVAPDLRRRGCARAMLNEAVIRAAERELKWVWMDISASNAPAIQCALANGFRRYLPQYLARSMTALAPGSAHLVKLTELRGKDAAKAIHDAAGIEADAGDAWAAGYARQEHPSLPDSTLGRTFAAEAGDVNAGVTHLEVDGGRARVWLWLGPEFWAGDLELGALRATLNVLQRTPSEIQIRLGSGDHLRAAAERYKAVGFNLEREPRARFLRVVAA